MLVPEETNYARVKAFMEKMQLPRDMRPGDFGYHELCGIRSDMLLEEVVEFNRAVRANDRAEMFDALLDLHYYLLGTYVSLGFQEDKVNEGFKRVHISNMEKERGQGKRQTQWDVIKPEGWTAAELEDLV